MTDSELDEFLSQNDAELEALLVQIDKNLVDYFKAELPQQLQHLTTSNNVCSTENDNSKSTPEN